MLLIIRRLDEWVSPSDLTAEVGATYRTVQRILAGIDEEVGLERRKVGRRVEYRLRRNF